MAINQLHLQRRFSSNLANNTFLRALFCETTEYTPIWLMRQAGRYLPEYQATRARAGSFLALAKNPALAAEVAMQPLKRFPLLDAAILFSDILTIPDAMGLGLSFVNGEGPCFAHPVRSEKDIAQLELKDLSSLQYVFDAIAETKSELTSGGIQKVPLIGFSGSPFTLACYMVEGRSGSNFHTIKTMLYKNPDWLQQILAINSQAIVEYLNAQIIAGAQAIMIFDTWGGILTQPAYKKFSLAPIKTIISKLVKNHNGGDIPVIVFTKGGGLWLAETAASGTNAVGLDWSIDPKVARQMVGCQVALQGSLDPTILFADKKTVQAEAEQLLDAYGAMPGHVFNLGHGVMQHTPVENVSTLIETVHFYSRQQRC